MILSFPFERERKRCQFLGPCINGSAPPHNEGNGYVTVEPRSIWAPEKGFLWIGRRLHAGPRSLHAVGGKIPYGRERLCCSRTSQEIDCNRVPTDRAGSSEDRTECRRLHLKNYALKKGRSSTSPLKSGPELTVPCSRKVAWGCKGILYGRTNHYHGL